MSGPAPARHEIVYVPLASIVDPATPARASMDDAKFAELVVSIRKFGILQPLVLMPVPPLYEVLAGHRRRLAAIAAGLTEVPAVIRLDGDTVGEAIKFEENARREDLNPAEEAGWFAELLEKRCGGDVDQLAALLGLTRSYIDSRLPLLTGYEEVFDALRANVIGVTVAMEFNKFKDRGDMLMYLDAAKSGGATARNVRDWRHASEKLAAAVRVDPNGEQPHVGGVEQPRESMLSCLLCCSSADPSRMGLFYIHEHCLMALEKTFGVELRGVFHRDTVAARLAAQPGPTS